MEQKQTFEEVVVGNMYEHINDESLERIYNENLDKYNESERVLLDIAMEMDRRYGKENRE